MEQDIILLFGGESNERLVSVASAQYMAQALGAAKLWFWQKDGRIFDINYQDLIEHKNPFIERFTPNNNPIFDNIETAIASPICSNHVFVLALHGGAGEDGRLQTLLEKNHRPFTGSNAKTSK